MKLSKPFLDITIPEAPIAMQRPRLGKGHTYNPQADEKVRLGWIFKEHMMKTRKNSTDKPLIVQIVFSFKRAKSSPKHMTKRPDIDNCIKFYLDAMSNDIVYLDDSAVVELKCSKGYAENPSVHIVIFEV